MIRALVLILLAASGALAAPQSRFNAADTGAVPDGTTDNTAPIQKSLDAAAKAGGGIVELTGGRYRVNGNLSIPAGVTLQGTYRSAPTARNIDAATGTVLLAYAGRGSAEGAPFIRLAGDNAVLAGVVVAYPEWKRTDVPPVPYPPCVASTNTDNTAILDCCFLNPYEAIRLVKAHRHLVRNVTGYPISRGIYVDECYDIGRIENIHFWPFGVAYRADDPYCKWINTNGVAFELARTDWHYVHNTFCFGYGVGYKFSQSKAGSANGNFLGLGADSCRRAVLVEQAQPPGLLITNGEFVGRWGSEDSVCIEIAEKAAGKVSLVNCSFWGPIDRCVWMRSATGQFTASACHFVDWDNTGRSAPAIQLDAGRAIVQGCTFTQGGIHIQAAAEVRSALLVGNQADGGFRVEGPANPRIRSFANEDSPMDAEPQARAHYRVTVGDPGDGAFLRQFHGRERMGAGANARPARWSTQSSKLALSVPPGKPCTIEIELTCPPQAESPDAGLYLGDKRLASIDKSTTKLTATLPPSSSGQHILDLRCKGWVPRAIIPKSQDDRTLGVTVFSITVKAEDAPARVFNANSGEWVPRI